MVYKAINYAWILLLVFLKIRSNNADIVKTTTINKNLTSPAIQKLFDRGYPNFREPGTFGNSPNNYPGNAFQPYGNQDGKMQRPSGYGWNQDPSQYNSQRPYQRPSTYPGYQEDGRYPQRPNNFGSGYDPGFNPSYHRSPYYIRPGNLNSPYQNGGMLNQGYPNRPIGSPDNNGYYPNGGQYPPQGNFQGNPSTQPGGLNSNYRPNYPSNYNDMPIPNIHSPANNFPYPNQPNQYPPGNGLGSAANVKIKPNQNGNYASYLSNNISGNRPNIPSNIDNSSIQLPSKDADQIPGNKNGPASSNVLSNGVSKNQLSPVQQYGPGNGSNANGITGILGKPVFVPSASSLGQPIGGSSTEKPSYRECIKNCPSTSEYNPVCGTNNVTYTNLGKFYCARSCGKNINIRQIGRCSG